MDIECIVCGSPHNEQALRCVVCGADLPTNTTGDHTQAYALDVPQPLQTLGPGAYKPPSRGSVASDFEIKTEIGFQAPINIESSDLLEPESLSISTPPEAYQHQMTLNGGPVPPEMRREAFVHSEELAPRQIERHVDPNQRTLTGAPEWTDSAHQGVDAAPDDLGSARTWIGVPIPQEALNAPRHHDESAHNIHPASSVQGSGALGGQGEAYPQLFSLNPNALDAPQGYQDQGYQDQGYQDQGYQDQAHPHPSFESSVSRPMSAGATALEAGFNSNQARMNGQSGSEASRISDQVAERLAPESHVSASTQISHERGQARVEVAQVSHAEAHAETHAEIHAETHPKLPIDRPSYESPISSSYHKSVEQQNTSELPTQSSGLGWFAWTFLVLTSIALGVSAALYILAPPPAVDETEPNVHVTSMRYDRGSHWVTLRLNSTERAQLLTPESWVSAEHREAFSVLRGEREVTLKLRDSQLTLGETQLNAQWSFVGSDDAEKRVPAPVMIAVPLLWRLDGVEPAADANGFDITIKLADQTQLKKSDVEYTKRASGLYRLHIPQTRIVSPNAHERIATLSFTFQQGERAIQRRATFMLPSEPTPLTLMGPVHDYARPGTEVLVSGLSGARAQVEVSAYRLGKDGIAASTPNHTAHIQADEKGRFQVTVSLKSDTRPGPEGDLWRLDVEAQSGQAPKSVESVTVKRSHSTKWYRFYNRMKTRRDRAKKKYRLFKESRLRTQTETLEGKSGQIRGIVTEIRRGAKPKDQRLLVHTCKRGDGCPVWIHDSKAFWVKEGQSVHIFAVFKGMQTYTIGERKLTLPELSARLTTP